jgi:hypothetical protein
MSEKRGHGDALRSLTQRTGIDSNELKFLQVSTQEETGGGWYRELDDTQIEVLTRARLERVDVEIDSNAESTAREKIAEMMCRGRDTSNTSH